MLYPRYINVLRRSGSSLLRNGIAIDRALLPFAYKSQGPALFKFGSEKGAMLGAMAGMVLPCLVNQGHAGTSELFREAVNYATDVNVIARIGVGSLLGFGAGGAAAAVGIVTIRASAGLCAAAGYGLRQIGDRQFLRAVRNELAQLNPPGLR